MIAPRVTPYRLPSLAGGVKTSPPIVRVGDVLRSVEDAIHFLLFAADHHVDVGHIRRGRCVADAQLDAADTGLHVHPGRD